MPADPDVAAIQHRTLRVLVAGQVIGAAALAAAVTVGAFVVQDILGDDTPWAGAATATVTTGTAVMAQLLSRRMESRGRRSGLATGYVLAAIGSSIAAVGAQLPSLPLFILGLFLYGNGQAANLLARYTATDLAAEHERSRAMSRIVFASTFGAVLGPLLIGPIQHVGEEWMGLGRYTGPWIFSAACLAGAAVNTQVRLRPDPLLVARAAALAADGPANPPRPQNLLSTVRHALSAPDSRTALASMIISQTTMVAVMAMTPVHLKLHGHETVSQFVVSLHIAGMFAFSPFVGRYCDRPGGRMRTIRVGASLLVLATALAALSGDVEQLLFPALWILGLGWNFGLIGGSTLLVDATEPEHRVATQGVADLLMSLSGGVAGFASGFIRRSVGYHLLATAALVAALALVLIAQRGARSRMAWRMS